MAELSWSSWILNILFVAWDTIFQRWSARHVPAKLPLPPLNHLTAMITGATSGIGLHTAKLVPLFFSFTGSLLYSLSSFCWCHHYSLQSFGAFWRPSRACRSQHQCCQGSYLAMAGHCTCWQAAPPLWGINRFIPFLQSITVSACLHIMGHL